MREGGGREGGEGGVGAACHHYMYGVSQTLPALGIKMKSMTEKNSEIRLNFASATCGYEGGNN